MLKLVLLLSLAAVGLTNGVETGYRINERLSVDVPTYTQRIVGGLPTVRGDVPYQVALTVRYRLLCGGSILSPRLILTAAHCVYHKDHLNPIEVVAGMVKMSNWTDTQVLIPQRIIPHPKYASHNEYDIALLHMPKPFKFNKFVQPIALPKQDAEFTGDTILTGWGSISNNRTVIFPDCLQRITLPLVPIPECAAKFEIKVSELETNICTGPIGGNVSACFGDSGGPLVKEVDGKLTVIGIVSWGSNPCGIGFPTAYAKVSKFIDFIKEFWL